jgi:hypothetical protein
MRDGAPLLCVGRDKGHRYEPSKDLWFRTLPYVHNCGCHGRSFPMEGEHKPFRHNLTKKPLIPPIQISLPPRANPTPQQQPVAAEPVRPIGSTG